MTKIDTIPASVMSIAVKLLQEYIPELTAGRFTYCNFTTL